MTNDETIARAFKSLAHPRRVKIFRILATNPETGRSFTTLHNAMNIGETPLVHHLREMERGGLITRKRRGAEVVHVLTTDLLFLAMDETKRLGRKATGPAPRRAA